MVKVFLLIVVGLAGDATHAEVFQKWGAQLAESSAKLGVTAERFVYLVDQPPDGETRVVENKRITGEATIETVTKALGTFAAQAGPDDVVVVTLIGHGDFNGKEAKFNLRRRDMTPASFKPLLDKIRSRVVFVNTTSASGPFVAELSGPNRTIIAATRNGAETYDTLFGGHFVEALTAEAADLDKNKRISVLEAFQFTTAEVQRAYEREGLLMTEHALLDDDGDKEGTQKPTQTTKDGKVAMVLSLGSIDTSTGPSDPKIAALYAERRELERRIENLRLLKDSMPPDRYTAELESTATALARKTQEIRAAEAAQKK
jgi:hypothetical protein